jgi:hypothetical protein
VERKKAGVNFIAKRWAGKKVAVPISTKRGAGKMGDGPINQPIIL